MLDYGEPQVLEFLKITPPSRLYLVLFPIEDSRQPLKTAKRILRKEKIDRQLLVQSSSTPFMNIWDGCNSGKKVVTFDIQDELDDMLDKTTSMIN